MISVSSKTRERIIALWKFGDTYDSVIVRLLDAADKAGIEKH